MPDEHNAFDLAALKYEQEQWADTTKIDRSGKPAPVNVRVQLNSGVVVKCDCRYAGINPKDGDRIFTVIAEIDWENYQPVLLLVEEAPNDVEYRFRVAGLPDELDEQYRAGLRFIPERIVYVK
jgi:hypothetical protein